MLTAAVACGCASGLARTGADRWLGVFVGLFLAVLVAWAVRASVKPQTEDFRADERQALLILAAICIAKAALLPLFPGFGPDIGSYQAWAARVADVGPAKTYVKGFFIDYPPGYLYALWAAGWLVRSLGLSGVAQRMVVESPALIADFLAGWVLYAAVRRTGSRASAYGAMLIFALNPAALFDTVVWGQSDSLLALVMLTSALAVLDSRYGLAWALGAVALLIKPQALMYLPVLGFWTLYRAPLKTWFLSAGSFLGTWVIGLVPFQVGHKWGWIFSLYYSTAAYYHETSVNAFNLMALLGGLRQSDSTPVLGIPAFYVGMALLVPLYAIIAWALARDNSRRGLLLASFVAIFGFFMLAPRMHERYLYPALVFLAPLAVEEATMAALFALLTITFLVNLAYVKHALETVVFLPAHDPIAIIIAAANLVGLGVAVRALPIWRHPLASGAPVRVTTLLDGLLRSPRRAERAAQSAGTAPKHEASALPWLRSDTAIVTALLLVAAAIRFWRLGRPPEIVFDEVHFVGQARHYLRAEPFLDPHPPLAKLVIALGILLFGDHPASWRIGTAVLGTGLVGITYLLGRRMFGSRLAAMLAGLFVAVDGMFIVDSRIAVIDIVYVTAAAWSYLLFFRFVQQADTRARRRTLAWLGVALGLCLGAKLYVPAFTFLLVMGFLVGALIQESHESGSTSALPQAVSGRRTWGAVLLVSSVAAIGYIACFLPHYFLGWWGGIEDLFHYYGQVIWYEQSVSSATHPYASPWWSWPLMLRPIAYWQTFPKSGPVATIWGGGNPAIWWGALTAIVITVPQAFERRRVELVFMVTGYIVYLAIWAPIGRTLFLYHYMPAVYLGFLALAMVLAQSWNGEADPLEEVALLLTLGPVFILGLGGGPGTVVLVAVLGLYASLYARSDGLQGKLVAAVFVLTVIVVSIYFFPVWTGLHIPRASYYARMWLQGPGLRNWI